MKRDLLFIFAIAFLFAGCASKTSDESTEISVPQIEDTAKNTEEKLPPSKYDDWKYKGFGTELPEWFDSALEYDDVAVKAGLKLSPETLIRIIITEGKDVDQCEQKFSEFPEELASDFEVLQSFWARLNPLLYSQEDLYNSVRIYVSKDEVLEIEDN